MRLHCDAGEIRREARLEEQQKWHTWFAWYPIKLGYNDCRWLEYVERRLVCHNSYYHGLYFEWEYRELTIKV